jgi:hypothetical protein
VVKDWRLNERHYGGLTGLDKAQCVKEYGKEQVIKVFAKKKQFYISRFRFHRAVFLPVPVLFFDKSTHKSARYERCLHLYKFSDK